MIMNGKRVKIVRNEADGTFHFEELSQEEIDSLPSAHYMLVDDENQKIIDTVDVLGASEAKAYFALTFPGYYQKGWRVYLKVGGQDD